MLRALTVLMVGLPASLQAQDSSRAVIPDTARIHPIGRFSDVRYTEEHAYGYAVDLWRAGQRIFGLLEVAGGLAGDTPAGELTDVRYDPRTGDLRFTAKVTTGVTFAPGAGRMVPSRDLFQFKGRLGAKELKGALSHQDQLRPNLRSVEQAITLPRLTDQPGIDASHYGEWRRSAGSILQFRGPKW